MHITRQIPISITGSAIIDSKSESGLERNTEREKLEKKTEKLTTFAQMQTFIYLYIIITVRSGTT